MPDGGEMGAYLALPASGTAPGVLVLMEIFGVGSYIRRAAERLAELGYVALAPDLYRRTAPGSSSGTTRPDCRAAFAAAGQARPRRRGPGRDRRPRSSARPARGAGPGRRARLLPRRLAGLRGRGRRPDPPPPSATTAPPWPRARRGRADHLPGAVSLRRPGPVHPARAGRARGQRRGGSVPTGSRHIQPDAGHAFDNHDSAMFLPARGGGAGVDADRRLPGPRADRRPGRRAAAPARLGPAESCTRDGTRSRPRARSAQPRGGRDREPAGVRRGADALHVDVRVGEHWIVARPPNGTSGGTTSAPFWARRWRRRWR